MNSAGSNLPGTLLSSSSPSGSFEDVGLAKVALTMVSSFSGYSRLKTAREIILSVCAGECLLCGLVVLSWKLLVRSEHPQSAGLHSSLGGKSVELYFDLHWRRSAVDSIRCVICWFSNFSICLSLWEFLSLDAIFPSYGEGGSEGAACSFPICLALI